MTLAIISQSLTSLSKHNSRQTPSPGHASRGFGGQPQPPTPALLSSLPAPQPGHLQAQGQAARRGLEPAAPLCLHSTFIPPFTAEKREEALFVPNIRVHLPKPRRRTPSSELPVRLREEKRCFRVQLI